jgi:hypothetical protein
VARGEWWHEVVVMIATRGRRKGRTSHSRRDAFAWRKWKSEMPSTRREGDHTGGEPPWQWSKRDWWPPGA